MNPERNEIQFFGAELFQNLYSIRELFNSMVLAYKEAEIAHA